MAFIFLPSLIVTAAIAIPHIALAHYLGFSLSEAIPEPLLSLFLLVLISSFSLVFLKPIVLDIAVSTSPTSKSRHVASWVSSNVHALAFALLWNAILGRPCSPSRKDIIVAAQILSGILVFIGFAALNCKLVRALIWKGCQRREEEERARADFAPTASTHPKRTTAMNFLGMRQSTLPLRRTLLLSQ